MNKSGLADSPFFGKQTKNEKRQPRHHDTMVLGNQDTVISTIVESILIVGKEAATYRLTLKEKRAMARIIYDFYLENKRTTENEIVRIALNLLFCNYKKNRKNSNIKRIISIKNNIKKSQS